VQFYIHRRTPTPQGAPWEATQRPVLWLTWHSNCRSAPQCGQGGMLPVGAGLWVCDSHRGVAPGWKQYRRHCSGARAVRT